MIPSIGPLEIIVVLAIALIIFGPKRIPKLGRSVGQGIRELRGSLESGDGSDGADQPGPGPQPSSNATSSS